MNQKEFDRLQTVIQWVADEKRRYERGESPEGVVHDQTLWAQVRVPEEAPVVSAALADGDTTDWLSVTCATACCVAGDVCLLEGDSFLVSLNAVPMNGTYVADSVLTPEGAMNIPDRAKRLLGIGDDEARRLFDGGRPAAVVIAIAKAIAHDHGYQLEVV